jgi:hypothetical protein
MGRDRARTQVVASLLVSVVMLGFKLSALKRLVEVTLRRTELKAALAFLQPKLEEESAAGWLDDTTHDAAQRHARIGEMASPSGRAYTAMENAAIERGAAMFAAFDGSSASVTQVKHSATMDCSETKYDGTTGLLLGRVEGMIRATPQEIAAYILNYDGRHVQSGSDTARDIRCETLEHVNGHHTVVFHRKRQRGFADRTFLNSIVAKKIEDDPPTHMVVVLPIPSHAKIGRKDEKGAVRAENCRAFKLAEMAPGVTRIQYCCSLDLRGLIPQYLTNTIAVPGQNNVPQNLQRYFQHIRPLSECDAEDGRVVGHMLLDLVQNNLKDLAHAIRLFANRTSMLRQCSCRHLGAMHARLLSADARAEFDDAAAIVVLGPSALTGKQATAIGSVIASSVRRSHAPAAALKQVVQSHAVLQAMKSRYAWFVPMLEVITACKAAELRRPSLMEQLSLIVQAKVADEESSFSSVVQLDACSILHCLSRALTLVDTASVRKACVWLCTPLLQVPVDTRDSRVIAPTLEDSSLSAAYRATSVELGSGSHAVPRAQDGSEVQELCTAAV